MKNKPQKGAANSAKAAAAREKRIQQQRGRFQERLKTRETRLNSIGAPLLRFFGPLGIAVELRVHLERDEYVVGGRPIPTPSGGWHNLPSASRDHEIDKFIAQHLDLAKLFVDSVITHTASLWPDARPYHSVSDHGFVLAMPEADVGFVLISPTHARVFQGGPTLQANYLSPGAHWDALKKAVEANEAQQRSGERPLIHRRPGMRRLVRVPLRIVTAVPEGAPRATARFLVDASRRLRLERQMAYGSPVVLEGDFGRIRFDPIDGPASDLIVPFTLLSPAGTVEGGIALSGERDPLTVELYHDDLADDMFVWTTALSGYADLTTWDVVSAARKGRPARGSGSRVPTSPRGNTASTGRVLRGSARPEAKRRLPRGAAPTNSPWPSHLKPLADTAIRLESVVAGHKRLLPRGWTPSTEAIERATLVGIKLAPGETWVRPHERGIGGDELRFAWKRHRALTSL